VGLPRQCTISPRCWHDWSRINLISANVLSNSTQNYSCFGENEFESTLFTPFQLLGGYVEMYCINGFEQCSTVMPSVWNNFWYDTTGYLVHLLCNELLTTPFVTRQSVITHSSQEQYSQKCASHTPDTWSEHSSLMIWYACSDAQTNKWLHGCDSQ